MSPDIKAWMRPEDLALGLLDDLPWPAYLNLVNSYFECLGYRLRSVRGFDDRSEYMMVSSYGERRLLLCCSSRMAQKPCLLATVSRSMNEFRVAGAVVASPGHFHLGVVESSRQATIDLYSATRLKALIERLPSDQRRQVLDSIRARPLIEQY